jgi:pyroglutamyl-peptidase
MAASLTDSPRLTNALISDDTDVQHDGMALILLTGFEPFDGAAVNPSAEVATLLDGWAFGESRVRAAVLPVHHVAAAAAVQALLDAHDPGVVVHLGLAGGRAQIALERVALNVMDYAIPDNAGYQACDEPCVPNGPAAYFSTLPLRTMLEALRQAGVPAYLSNTAGTYLCNFVMYTTLHALAERSAPPGAGFIHLPALPSMVVAGPAEQPSMDLATMLHGVEAALRVLERK